MKSLFLFSIISIIFHQAINASVVSIINNGISKVMEKISNDTEIAPEKCPMNMALVPVDNENSTNWICDCSVPSFLYFAEKNSCYLAYKQGPCPPEYYLILPLNENLAKCEKNPCLKDGLVPFKGTCACLFGRGSPCYLGFFLVVNPETFELTCSMRKFNIINAPQIQYPRGTRRNALGVCKKEFA